MIDKSVVKVLTTKMRVTSSGFHLEDALLNRKKGVIEGSSTEIENEDVALASHLVKTVGP